MPPKDAKTKLIPKISKKLTISECVARIKSGEVFFHKMDQNGFYDATYTYFCELIELRGHAEAITLLDEGYITSNVINTLVYWGPRERDKMAVGRRGWTADPRASISIDSTNMLIDRGRVIFDSNRRGGFSPLLFAIANDHTALAKKLIEKGADVNLGSNQHLLWGTCYFSPLEAAQQLNYGVAEMILNVRAPSIQKLKEMTEVELPDFIGFTHHASYLRPTNDELENIPKYKSVLHGALLFGAKAILQSEQIGNDEAESKSSQEKPSKTDNPIFIDLSSRTKDSVDFARLVDEVFSSVERMLHMNERLSECIEGLLMFFDALLIAGYQEALGTKASIRAKDARGLKLIQKVIRHFSIEGGANVDLIGRLKRIRERIFLPPMPPVKKLPPSIPLRPSPVEAAPAASDPQPLPASTVLSSTTSAAGNIVASNVNAQRESCVQITQKLMVTSTMPNTVAARSILPSSPESKDIATSAATPPIAVITKALPLPASTVLNSTTSTMGNIVASNANTQRESFVQIKQKLIVTSTMPNTVTARSRLASLPESKGIVTPATTPPIAVTTKALPPCSSESKAVATLVTAPTATTTTKMPPANSSESKRSGISRFRPAKLKSNFWEPTDDKVKHGRRLMEMERMLYEEDDSPVQQDPFSQEDTVTISKRNAQALFANEQSKYMSVNPTQKSITALRSRI